jgi:hypothetical protein
MSVEHESVELSPRGPATPVRRMAPVRVVQRKVTVGTEGDRFEREADAVARRVVARLGTGAGAGLSPRVPVTRISRMSVSVGAAGGVAGAGVESELRAMSGGGRPLSRVARGRMEGAFGADFSRVRVHEGARAASLNRRVQAKAFTYGRDVFFRDGVPDVGSRDGAELMAHELTHTIQQGAGRIQRKVIQRHPGPADKKPKTPEGGENPKSGTTESQQRAIKVGHDRVLCDRPEDRTLAELLVKRISESGVALNSARAVRDVKHRFAPGKGDPKPRSWTISELVAIDSVVAWYRVLLEGDADNELKQDARAALQAIGKLDTAPLDPQRTRPQRADHVQSTGTLVVYRKGTSNLDPSQLITALHEKLASPMLRRAAGGFQQTFAAQKGSSTTGTSGEKAYHSKIVAGSKDDFIDTVVLFCTKPKALEATCPQRHRYMSELRRQWSASSKRGIAERPGIASRGNAKKQGKPQVENVLDVSVEIGSDADRQQALIDIVTITEAGFVFDSAGAAAALTGHDSGSVPVEAVPWTVDQLRALGEAVQVDFGPLAMNPKRPSAWDDVMAKLPALGSVGAPAVKGDGGTPIVRRLGDHLVMFSGHGSDALTQFAAVLGEFARLLLSPAVEDFAKQRETWQKSGSRSKGEQPCAIDAADDLCQSFVLFATNSAALAATRPRRHGYCVHLMESLDDGVITLAGHSDRKPDPRPTPPAPVPSPSGSGKPSTLDSPVVQFDDIAKSDRDATKALSITGVRVDSRRSAAALTKRAKGGVVVKPARWRWNELLALGQALDRFQGLLSTRRPTAEQAQARNALTRIGKIDGGGKEHSTIQIVAGSLLVVSSGTHSETSERLRGRYSEVITPSVLRYLLDRYIATTGYWQDRSSPRPLPEYEESLPHEADALTDLCKAFEMYAASRDLLRLESLPRYTFIAEIHNSWHRGEVAHTPRRGIAAPTITSVTDPIENEIIIDVGSERVRTTEATRDADLDEAFRILRTIWEQNAVAINTPRLLVRQIQAIPLLLQLPSHLRPGPSAWSMSELRALEFALQRYRNITGPRRASSSRAAVPQELVVAGRINSIFASGYFYPAMQGFVVGNGARDPHSTDAWVACHELAHALAQYCLDDFVDEVGYWSSIAPDATRHTVRGGAKPSSRPPERPPTGYGDSMPGEDFADSVAIYFVKPERLRRDCRIRFNFIDALVKSWNVNEKPEPDGDMDEALRVVREAERRERDRDERKDPHTKQ